MILPKQNSITQIIIVCLKLWAMLLRVIEFYFHHSIVIYINASANKNIFMFNSYTQFICGSMINCLYLKQRIWPKITRFGKYILQ